MRRPDGSPEEYLASIEEPRLREAVELLRALIHEAAPDVAEGMRYGMLADLAAGRT